MIYIAVCLVAVGLIVASAGLPAPMPRWAVFVLGLAALIAVMLTRWVR